LEACSNLKRLYLYSNRIRRIQGLQACKQLEVLWLADNQIVVVEGLEGLVKLRELNLARNQVDQIGDVFSANSALECLNLADNHVRPILTRITSPYVLLMKDYHWNIPPTFAAPILMTSYTCPVSIRPSWHSQPAVE
jgi:Leucine-rich repeat (LRR) protein